MRLSAVPSLGWRLAGEDGAGDSHNVRATRLRATASIAHASELIVRPGSDGCRASKMPRDAHRLRHPRRCAPEVLGRDAPPLVCVHTYERGSGEVASSPSEAQSDEEVAAEVEAKWRSYRPICTSRISCSFVSAASRAAEPASVAAAMGRTGTPTGVKDRNCARATLARFSRRAFLRRSSHAPRRGCPWCAWEPEPGGGPLAARETPKTASRAPLSVRRMPCTI